MKRWRKGVLTPQKFSDQQKRLETLSGEMLDRYREELDAEINDPDRIKEVYGSAFATSTNIEQAQNIAGLAASMLDAPSAQVALITEKDQKVIASNGRAAGDNAPVNDTYCQHVIGTGRELAITNSAEHPLVCDTSFARNGDVVSYLGVPVVSMSGAIIGVLCVHDTQKREWTVAEVGMLTQLAAVLTRSNGH